MIPSIFIYWIDKEAKSRICDELGLSHHTTLNGKTVVSNPTRTIYDKLVEYQEWDILRLTLRP